jgi:hypothetical protein
MIFHLGKENPSFAKRKDENRFLIFIDFKFLECHSCEENFMDLCGMLNEELDTLDAQSKIVGIFNGDNQDVNYKETIELWKKYNNIKFFYCCSFGLYFSIELRTIHQCKSFLDIMRKYFLKRKRRLIRKNFKL